MRLPTRPSTMALSMVPLAAFALGNGVPILGVDNGCSSTSASCDWMAKLTDNTKLVSMSIPGTHDAATWNYTQATQDALLPYTGSIKNAQYFRCQDHSLFDQLNGGIRAFDLRYSWNPDNTTIGFYHAEALLAPNTTLEDVFAGFYAWLDQHPTEALLISMKYESGPRRQDTAALQDHLYSVLNSDQAKRYWIQTNGSLGTLGQARGKMTLLQRFDWSKLPSTATQRMGIPLSPSKWTDNGVAIEIVYNTTNNQIAYIEDYYEIGLPSGAGVAANVQWKYNATIAHIQNATQFNPDQLYISFASSEHNSDVPPEYPVTMALGNGTDVPGVNQKLSSALEGMHGRKRLGVIMLDFFATVPGLVEQIIKNN